MAAHNGLADAVLKLVRAHPGVDKAQIGMRLAAHTRNVKQALYRMRKAGILHTAGPERFWCYFSTAEEAAAHEAHLQAEVEERRRLGQVQQIRQANLRRKAQRMAQGKASNNNRAAMAVQLALQPGTVLSPDVRVTIAPAPRDRWAPEPGWERVITADALARRGVAGAQ